jgi:L-lactate dehydrogenase complex protein LldE
MKVGLFVTCLLDLLRPTAAFAALRLLRAAGCEVHVSVSQTCCGQPAYNSGDRAAARTLAAKTAREFTACEYVVAPSGSCAGMMRRHYPGLFVAGDADAAEVLAFAGKVWELTAFLHDVLQAKPLADGFNGKLTFHDSCSGLRELGVHEQPRALLRAVPGLELAEMRDSQVCCGFGGTFCVKFPDISAHMASSKCSHIQSSGAAAVTACDWGCLMNIEGRLRALGDNHTQVLHVAEILAGPEPA